MLNVDRKKETEGNTITNTINMINVVIIDSGNNNTNVDKRTG